MSSSENENNLNCVGQSTDKSKANNCVNEMKITGGGDNKKEQWSGKSQGNNGTTEESKLNE